MFFSRSSDSSMPPRNDQNKIADICPSCKTDIQKPLINMDNTQIFYFDRIYKMDMIFIWR